MKDGYKKKVKKLRSAINYQKIHQIKYLNQDIVRKRNTIAKKEATIKKLKSQLSNSVVAEQLNAMKKNAKNKKQNKSALHVQRQNQWL